MKTKNEIVSISEAIREFLQPEHVGKGRAIKAVELYSHFGTTPRQLRVIVSALRSEGEPICSDGSGYYYAASAEEIAKTRMLIRAHAASTMRAAKGLDKALKRFTVVS